MELGSTVTLFYKGTLEDGTLFGLADESTPMEFQTGMDMTIPGFEREILTMNEVGEKKTFTVGMYDAYGEYLDDNTQEVPRQFVTRPLKVGQRTWMGNGEDDPQPVTVLEIGPKHILFDMNHPLAGHDLTFEVEIIDIEPPEETFVPAAEKQRMLERQQPGPVMN